MLTKSDIDKYNSDGYCVINNAINTDCIENFLSELQKIVSKVLKVKYSDNLDDLDNLINKAYNSNQGAGGFIYDAMNMHNLLYSLFDLSSIKSSLKGLLSNKEGLFDLAISDHQFRIESPLNCKNTLGWHQESSYYSEICSDSNSTVAFIPLKNCSPEDGSIVIDPRSHLVGRVEHSSNKLGEHKTKNPLTRGTSYLSEETYDFSNAFSPNLKPGSVAFFHFDLFHRSGINKSGKIRYCALARCSNIYGKGFLKKYNIW
tara:strand:+ start:2596 stop:3372 length:777 start_codon:yes stop_codon:yes gene_type:complete